MIRKEIVNNIGVITLADKKNLNVLNEGFMDELTKSFDDFIENDLIKLIIIDSEGRVFSAGGDMKFAHEEFLKKKVSPMEFFEREREILERFNNPKKPIISFISGIVMGGGIGITVDSDIRVVDETTKWSMPEARIGFIPDIGIGYYFSKMEKHIGLYHSLLGKSIDGSDLTRLNLAEHFIENKYFKNAKEDLKKLNIENDSRSEIIKKSNEILNKYRSKLEKSKIEEKEEDLLKYFNKNSLEEIFDELDKDKNKNEFAKLTLLELNKRCPVSLQIIFLKYFAGKNWDREETINYDLKLIEYCYKTGNMIEGLRAFFIDKDNLPKWNPDNIYKVNKDEIKKILAF